MVPAIIEIAKKGSPDRGALRHPRAYPFLLGIEAATFES
jgi:hypothetical protein